MQTIYRFSFLIIFMLHFCILLSKLDGTFQDEGGDGIGNELTGTIPTELGLLTELVELWIGKFDIGYSPSIYFCVSLILSF